MEMGVVPGGGSIMVHLLKFEDEIRKKLTAANAASQVRACLHGSCVCVRVRVFVNAYQEITLLLLWAVNAKTPSFVGFPIILPHSIFSCFFLFSDMQMRRCSDLWRSGRRLRGRVGRSLQVADGAHDANRRQRGH